MSPKVAIPKPLHTSSPPPSPRRPDRGNCLKATSRVDVVDTVFSLKPMIRDLLSMIVGPTTVVAVELDGRGGRDVTAHRQKLFLCSLLCLFILLILLTSGFTLLSISNVVLDVYDIFASRSSHVVWVGKARVRQDRKCQLFIMTLIIAPNSARKRDPVTVRITNFIERERLQTPRELNPETLIE